VVSSLDAVMVSQPMSYWGWLLAWDGGLMYFIIFSLWLILGILSSSVFLYKWHKRYGYLDIADILVALLMCVSGMISFVFVLCLFYNNEVKDFLGRKVL
jgi:hypothetical protein